MNAVVRESDGGAVSPILDLNGRPIVKGVAHYGADTWAPELRSWYPSEYSADGELLPELSTLRARTQDMIRNHGLTSGAVQTHLDNIIGPRLKLAAKPDYRVLGQSPEWAAEWSRTTEAKFRTWAEDQIDCYCDASRRYDLGGLLSIGYRQHLTSFEALSSIEWLPNRPGAKYSTAIQCIDPALLSNPDGLGDTDRLRAGVELGQMGEPLAYWLASHMQSDPMGFSSIRRWRRVPRFTPWGRHMIVHVFDGERAGQTRGKNGIVSVLAKMKMLEKFEQSTLQAAILNAMYAAVIESPMDWEVVGAAIGARNDKAKVANPLNGYMDQRGAWHKDGHIRYNGVKIPHLYPGEKLNLLAPQHPSAAFSSFEEAVLRHIAGGLNLSYEQLSRDYSKTNYSSARAAMLEAWRFFAGRRHKIAGRLATYYYAAWLEEAIDIGEIEIPTGAPNFYEAKAAWTRCVWIGPGRGHIDPLKEAQATKIEFEMNTTTLEIECAERGRDWEEVLEQRAMEAKRRKELERQYGVNLSPLESELPAAPTDVDVTGEGLEDPEGDGLDEEAIAELRAEADAYGVAVRAGVVTPQTEDEEHFRARMGLPQMSTAAREAWSRDQGTRRPITITPPPGSQNARPMPGQPSPGGQPGQEEQQGDGGAEAGNDE
jgi:lambda family phage portal protein